MITTLYQWKYCIKFFIERPLLRFYTPKITTDNIVVVGWTQKEHFDNDKLSPEFYQAKLRKKHKINSWRMKKKCKDKNVFVE